MGRVPRARPNAAAYGLELRDWELTPLVSRLATRRQEGSADSEPLGAVDGRRVEGGIKKNKENCVPWL